MPPFRNPVSDEEDSWTPPAYAGKPVEDSSSDKSDDKWSPPSYAGKAIEDTKPKKSEFKARVGRDAEDFVKDVKGAWGKASEPLTDAPTRLAERLSRYINPGSETKGIRGVGSAFVEGLGHAVSGLSSPLNLGLAALTGGSSTAEKAGMEGLAEGLHTGSRVLSAPVAAEGAKHVYQGIKNKDWAEGLSGALEAGTGALGLRGRVPEEPPIRQRPIDYASKSKEIPYKLDSELPTKELPKARKLLSPHSGFISGERGIAENRLYNRDTSDPYNIQQKHGGTLTSADVGERTSISPQIAAQYGLEPKTSNLPIKEGEIVPETPAEASETKLFNPFEKKSDDLRQRFKDVKEAATSRTSEEELTRGFGGSGHPESPDYTSKVLEAAGTNKEKPGLSVEDKEGFKHVVYRNKDGEPVAVAKVVTDSNGKSSIQDLAADKTKGLLTGRAMMHVGDKLQELGATESAGTISPDAQNFLDRMKGSPKKIKAASEFADSVQASPEIPKTPMDEPIKQTAKFAYEGPEGKRYNVEGEPSADNPSGRSSLSENDLKKLGIDVPESPPESPENANELPIRQNGDQIRAQMLADRQSKLAESSQADRNAAYRAELEKEQPTQYRKPISEWTPPDYAGKAVEEPAGIGARIKGFLKDEEGSAKLPDEEEKQPTGIKVWRGTRSGNPTVRPPREGYINTYSTSKDLANTYAGETNEAQPFTIKGKKIIEFPVTKSKYGSGNEFSKFDFDRRARQLGSDEVLVARQVVDSGPRGLAVRDPKYLWSYPSDIYAVNNHELVEAGHGESTEPQGEVTEMHGGLGAISRKTKYPKSQGPNGPVLDKLFQSMLDAKEKNVSQESSYRTERAKRFADFSGVKEEGEAGAAKSLSKLKGQYDKIEPGEGLKMEQGEVDQLFTAIKKANITGGEKARGYTALFKLMNGESVPQRNELALLDEVFGNSFADRITQMHGGLGATGIKIAKAANTMKSMENAVSLAAPLRHGAGLMYRKEFTPAFVDMFKFFGNKEYYNAAMDALQKRPNYMLGRESGLFFAKQGSQLNSEEEFLNSYVGDLPKITGIPQTVAASQRGYVGFLNKLRSDTFDGMIKTMKSLGHDISTTVGDEVIPSKGAKAIANFINNATGRGDLGSLNKITNELNMALWSPRMIASRINMLANPKIYMDLPKGMRLEGLKSLLGIASMGLVVNGLSILGGATVGTNILSTDFMKSRFKGNKLIDANAGMQQYVVAAARFLAGKTDSNTPTSRLEIAGRFLANKESPAASLAHTLLTARKFTGKSDDPETAGNFTDQYNNKTSIQSEISKRFTPIFIQDLQELMKNEPDWSENIGLNTAMAGASLAGMSQQYAEKKSKLRLGSMRLR